MQIVAAEGLGFERQNVVKELRHKEQQKIKTRQEERKNRLVEM